MKNITLIGNEWKERKTPNLTDQERELLRDMSEANHEERKVLMDRIREESLVAVTAEEAAQAQAIYDQHKIEGATLIAADITLPSGTGIINCRVEEEHKQIRF